MSPSDLRVKSNRWLRRIISRQTFGTVLNLGCGTDEDGEGSKYSRWFNADRVIRIDVERHPGLDAITTSERLPMSDGSCDAIFANWMIYKTNVRQTLSEMERVIRPGGELFLSYAGAEGSRELQELRQTLRARVSISDLVTIPYRAPRDRTPRIADLLHGRIGASCSQSTPPVHDGESLAVRIVEPVLLLIAHWDDEIVSAGGTLLKYGRGWDVVTVTKREHLAAFEEAFQEVCAECGARAVTLNIPHRTEPWRGQAAAEFYASTERTEITTPGLKAALQQSGIDLQTYGTIITHHYDGDVGRHVHHRQIARAIHQLCPQGNIIHFAPGHGELYTVLDPETCQKRNALLDHYRQRARILVGPTWEPSPHPLPTEERFAEGGLKQRLPAVLRRLF